MPYKDKEQQKLKHKEYYHKMKDTLIYKNPDGSWKRRPCKDTEEWKIRHREYLLKNKDKINARSRELTKQKRIIDKCPICNEITQLMYDHDHVTEKFRGYICRLCNLALGHAKDNISTLENMITYLRIHNAL